MTDSAPIYTLCIGSIRIEEVRNKSLWARIKRWFYMKDQAHNEFTRQQIAKEAKGELVDTMRNLE